jgi:hypothetical protein
MNTFLPQVGKFLNMAAQLRPRDDFQQLLQSRGQCCQLLTSLFGLIRLKNYLPQVGKILGMAAQLRPRDDFTSCCSHVISIANSSPVFSVVGLKNYLPQVGKILNMAAQLRPRDDFQQLLQSLDQCCQVINNLFG